METPLFYDLVILDNKTQTQTNLREYNRNNLRYFIQKLIFVPLDLTIESLRKIKRFLKKIRQAKPPI
jgi:hypothetical protein